MAKNELQVVELIDGKVLPDIIPVGMNKKELFNAIQDTDKVEVLVGKRFKILGLITEEVLVPKKNDKNRDVEENPYTDDELKLTKRVTIMTDIGNYHAFTSTLYQAMVKAVKVFADEFLTNEYELKKVPKGDKVIYNLIAQ